MPFSYGEAFLEINSSLLKRYAACANEDEIKKAESVWLEKLEREYAENRADGAGETAKDAWRGGNMNRRIITDTDDEGSEGDPDKASNQEDDGSEEEPKDRFELSDDTDDEEEMSELRRKVLSSKPFTDAFEAPPDGDQKSRLERVPPSKPPIAEQEDEAESEKGDDDGDEDDAEFDKIINATPINDKSGIRAKERFKGLGRAEGKLAKT